MKTIVPPALAQIFNSGAFWRATSFVGIAALVFLLLFLIGAILLESLGVRKFSYLIHVLDALALPMLAIVCLVVILRMALLLHVI